MIGLYSPKGQTLKVLCPELTGKGGARILLDDQDISISVAALRLEMRAGVVNRVTLELLPGCLDIDVAASVEPQEAKP